MLHAVGMKQISDPTTFAPDWLALREPADHAARDPQLLSAAHAAVGKGGVVLDLGSGTGSTVRAFAQSGLAEVQWRLLDDDPTLLSIARERHPEAECVLGSVLDIEQLRFENVHIVTASALMDLMTQGWLEAFADRLQADGIAFYAALNYDGQMLWTPEDRQDAQVTDAFNSHQKRDKGHGAALGPEASSVMRNVFEDRGYHVATAVSPWRLGPDQSALHEALLLGIADAAEEQGLNDAQDWASVRRAGVHNSNAVIGHIDLLATPKPQR